jgi:hypothetical protein
MDHHSTQMLLEFGSRQSSHAERVREACRQGEKRISLQSNTISGRQG